LNYLSFFSVFRSGDTPGTLRGNSLTFFKESFLKFAFSLSTSECT